MREDYLEKIYKAEGNGETINGIIVEIYDEGFAEGQRPTNRVVETDGEVDVKKKKVPYEQLLLEKAKRNHIVFNKDLLSNQEDDTLLKSIGKQIMFWYNKKGAIIKRDTVKELVLRFS